MKHHKICIPVSPGKRLGHAMIDVDEIRLSWDGGAAEVIYAVDIGGMNLDDMMFITVENFLGEVMTLGKRFVVSIKPKRLIMEDYDTTMNFNVDITRRYILIGENDTYEALHASTGGDDVNVIRIESENGSYWRK